MDIQIDHNLQEQTFFGRVNGEEAELAYSQPEDGIIDFVHTYVPEGLRGKGIGEQLVKAGFAYAQEKNMKIIPTCRFVAAFVKRNAAEYDSLMANKSR
jgi:predicted GNAT family acetyltransferase